MALTINLYNSPGERNILGRTKTSVKSMTSCEITDVCNIETPEILIDRDDTIISKFNYAEIPIFSRFYFLNGFEIVNGNQFKLYLESDPLESFKASILSSQAIAKRSANRGNPEIEDPLMVFKNIPKMEYRKCQTGFAPDGTGSCYAFILGGK